VVTPELKAALLAWVNQNGPMLCVAFVAACALLSFRKRGS
jgi:hypothetical protein